MNNLKLTNKQSALLAIFATVRRQPLHRNHRFTPLTVLRQLKNKGLLTLVVEHGDIIQKAFVLTPQGCELSKICFELARLEEPDTLKCWNKQKAILGIE